MRFPLSDRFRTHERKAAFLESLQHQEIDALNVSDATKRKLKARFKGQGPIVPAVLAAAASEIGGPE
jgi:hypothetical protein